MRLRLPHNPSAGPGVARGPVEGRVRPRRRWRRRATSRRSSWMATRSEWCGRPEEIGRRLREPLQAAQLRSIYAALRLIEAEWQGAAAGSPDVGQRLTQLRPQIAYLAAKHRTSVGPLRPVLEMGIGRVGKRWRAARPLGGLCYRHSGVPPGGWRRGEDNILLTEGDQERAECNALARIRGNGNRHWTISRTTDHARRARWRAGWCASGVSTLRSRIAARQYSLPDGAAHRRQK